MSLPRARGGISGDNVDVCSCWCSSPRTRGYFLVGLAVVSVVALFPAHAGVFPEYGARVNVRVNSSPRTRGYFQHERGKDRERALFPAHAGVFPCTSRTPCPLVTLPRARGGISKYFHPLGIMGHSSPRTRGYFRHGVQRPRCGLLFPAHAGVFPAFGDIDEPIERSSPRTRGYFRAVKDP